MFITDTYSRLQILRWICELVFTLALYLRVFLAKDNGSLMFIQKTLSSQIKWKAVEKPGKQMDFFLCVLVKYFNIKAFWSYLKI